MIGTLNSLGRDLDAKAVPEAEQRAHDGRALPLFGHALDEGAIDLDPVDLEVAQMVEARIAGAEVVERDPHARLAQRDQARLRHRCRSRTSAFSLTSISRRPGAKPGLAEDRKDAQTEARIAKLHRRDVERQRHISGPAAGVAAGGAQQLVAQLADQAAVLSQGDEAIGRNVAQEIVMPPRERLEAEVMRPVARSAIGW